jgi:hypothetical protein
VIPRNMLAVVEQTPGQLDPISGMQVSFRANMREAKSGGDEADAPAESPDGPNRPTAAVLWAHSDPDWQAEQRERWKESVLRLTRLLLDNGIDADVDLFHGHEPTDWARFGPRAIEASDWVLVAISPEWRRAFQGLNKPTESAGTVGEANTLLGMFVNDQAEFQQRVVLVLLPGRETSDVPPALVATTTYVRVPSLTSEGLEDLLRILHGRPAYPKTVPGPAPELAPRPVAPYVDLPDNQVDGDPPVETYIPIDRFDVVEAPIPPIGWAANEAFSAGFPPGWYDTTATEPTIEGNPALIVLRRDDRTGRPSDVASRGVIRCFSHGRGPPSEFFAVAGEWDQVRARATRRRVIERLRFVRAGGAPCYTFRLDGETQIKAFKAIPSALTEVHLFHDDEWFFMQLESDPRFHAEYQQDLATVLGTLTWKRCDIEPAFRPIERRSAEPPDPADSLSAYELGNMWWHRVGFRRDKLPPYKDACRRCGGTNKLLYTGAPCPDCNGTGRRQRPE